MLVYQRVILRFFVGVHLQKNCDISKLRDRTIHHCTRVIAPFWCGWALSHFCTPRTSCLHVDRLHHHQAFTMFVGKYPTSFKLIQHSYFTSPFSSLQHTIPGYFCWNSQLPHPPAPSGSSLGHSAVPPGHSSARSQELFAARHTRCASCVTLRQLEQQGLIASLQW